VEDALVARGGDRFRFWLHPLKGGRKKWPKALKVVGNKITMDLNEPDAAGLTPSQLRQALEVLRKATRILEAVAPP
jgi:hypothetical protein